MVVKITHPSSGRVWGTRNYTTIYPGPDPSSEEIVIRPVV
jgi:hypothetical protein